MIGRLAESRRTVLFGSAILVAVWAIPRPSRGAEVLFREDFEDADKVKGWIGKVQGETTFGGSKGAIKANSLKDNQWFDSEARVSTGKPLYKIGKETTVSFAYFIPKGPAEGEFKLQFATDNKEGGNIYCYPKKRVVGKWEIVSVKLSEFKFIATKETPPEGTGVGSMSFYNGKPNTGVDVYYDNMTVTEGGMPDDLEKFIKDREALVADQTGAIEKDRFVLSPDIVKACAEKYNKESIVPMSIAAVGSTAVKSLSFVAPLTKDRLKGYKVIDKVFTTKDGMTADAASTAVEKATKQKAEIVVIALDDAEVQRGTDPTTLGGKFKSLADAVRDAGGVPVLCTLMTRLPASGKYLVAVQAVNSAIIKDAAAAKAPLLDACGILNSAGDAAKNPNFSGNNVNQKGHEAVNEVLAALIGRLEKHVMGRAVAAKEEPAAVAPGEKPPKPAKPPDDDDDDEKTPTRKKDAKDAKDAKDTKEKKDPEAKKRYDDE